MRTRMQVMALALVMAAGSLLVPAPVAADEWLACLERCALEFWENDPYTVSMRGWCYILRCTGV